MKYLLILGLLSGCGSTEFVEEKNKKKPERFNRSRFAMNPRQQKIINCVEKFLDREVESKGAYEMCKDLFARTK